MHVSRRTLQADHFGVVLLLRLNQTLLLQDISGFHLNGLQQKLNIICCIAAAPYGNQTRNGLSHGFSPQPAWPIGYAQGSPTYDTPA